MDGLNLTTSLQTEALDTKSNIRSEIADLSRASLQNALANTVPTLTPTILSDSIQKPDFSKMSDEDYTKGYLRGTISDIFYKNPAIKRAPSFTDYNYAKKYDDPVLGFSASRSFQQQEDMYADYLQSGFVGGLTTGLKGLASRAASIVPKIASGFGHVGGAVIDILDGDAFKGQWNYAIDNGFSKFMHNADEGLREMAPIYADADYFEGGMWDKVMTGKFLADDMLDGIAYAASSIVNVPIIGALGKGASALGKGLNTAGRVAKVGKLTEPIAGFAGKAFSSETALGNTLLKANKLVQESKAAKYLTAPVEGGTSRIASWAKTGGYTMFNTFSEAGAEAYDLKKTLKEELIATGMSEQDAEKYATERAQETFNGNLLGLWASNLWELKTIFPKMFTSAADDIKSIQRKVRLGELNPDELKIFNKEVLKKIGTGIAVEGFYEENFQTALQQYEKNKLLSSDDEGFADTILGTINLMGKNASAFFKGATGGYQALSQDEKEGADSILLGGLIGIGMGAGGQVIQNKKDRTYFKDYKQQYIEYGKYQHGLFTMLADDKRNLLKSFTKTNPDGTTKKSYLNDNGEHEYDEKNVAKLLLFNLENKKLYNEYMQRVMMGDEVGASFLLDQAFARLTHQAVNNKFWQGDTKSAIEDLKLKIKDFEFEEDKEDLNVKREVEKRLSVIDQFENIANNIEDQLKDGFDMTTEQGQIEHLYSKSAMFYEATKIESLKRIQQQFAERALSGDTTAQAKVEELDKLIQDATVSYNQFSTKDARKQVFDSIQSIENKYDEYKESESLFSDDLVKKDKEIKDIKAAAENRELTDDEKNKIESLTNEMVDIDQNLSKLRYERFEYQAKTDMYTMYNRLGSDKNIKSHKNVLENYRITREGMVYFRTFDDKRITDSVKNEMESMELDTTPSPSPLSGTRVDIITEYRSRKEEIIRTIQQLDRIKELVDKIKNKTNTTLEDRDLVAKLTDKYKAIYASLYSPELAGARTMLDEQIEDYVNDVVDKFYPKEIEGLPVDVVTAMLNGVRDNYMDLAATVQSFKDQGIDQAIIDNYIALHADVAEVKDLMDSVLNRPSILDPTSAMPSAWRGHSFNPADYSAITIDQYEALPDKDSWLNRSIMVDEIAAAEGDAQFYTSLRDSDTLDLFDKNPQSILAKIMMLTGINKSVTSDERKDNPEYEGVAEKTRELIDILNEAYEVAVANTNLRDQEQQRYNAINKITLFSGIGVVIDLEKNTYTLDPEYSDIYTKIKDVIGDKFDELLDKAKNDTTDPFSQLYYEMILDEFRKKGSNAQIDAVVNNIESKLQKLRTDEEGKYELFSDGSSVTVTTSIPNSSFVSQFTGAISRLTGIRFMPKVIEGFLKDFNISTLKAEVENIESILNNPASTAEQKAEANSRLLGYRKEDKTEPTNIDIEFLSMLVDVLYNEQRLMQLRDDLNISKTFSISSYYNSQSDLATGEKFSLSPQQRISELEMTKRFRTLKGDPKDISSSFFYLNAIAGSGKTSGVGKWFASKLGLEDGEILVTSHLPKSSEVAAKQINEGQEPTLIFDFLDAFKNRTGNTITVNGIEIDLTELKLLVIDEAAALGRDQVYKDILEMIEEINKINGAGNKFTVFALGDTNQLTGDASGVNVMTSIFNKISFLPSLTISYRSSVTAISDAFNQFNGKMISVKDGIVSASNPIGEDAYGVHAINPMKNNVYDTFGNQINVSEGEKLIITTEAKKAEYQSKFPGVTVFTPEEAQSFTMENVFIDLPLDGNNAYYNKKMYVALSRASKYAMFVDYTESFNQSEDKNMRSIIELDRNQNEEKIQSNKTNYLSLLDHYLEVLGAKSPTTAESGTAPGPAAGPVAGSAPPSTAITTMTPEQFFDNHMKNMMDETANSETAKAFETLVSENPRYFELAKMFYLSQEGVSGVVFGATEKAELSGELRKMITKFTPDTEKAFDLFTKTMPC